MSLNRLRMDAVMHALLMLLSLYVLEMDASLQN